ncbi:MAG: sugar transferase [Alphaproteobacteria bacterium]|nr:sugar transferase [Alphaproteobacteria bacterium]MBL7099800.1 sugar transferase [Alphaproteobacteria bacterium]
MVELNEAAEGRRSFDVLQSHADEDRGRSTRVTNAFYAAFGKRAFDIAIASFALIFLSPVMLITALVVALKDGWPVIYRQHRAGRNLEPFVLVKFRTMVQDNNDNRAGGWKKSDPNWNEAKAAQGATRDPRLFPGAEFLRKHSFDELPQFWNVLLGDMSFIGPRPLMCAQVDENLPTRADQLVRRATVRPGITGLWQVSGRSDVTFDRMMSLDIEYVEKLSFAQDVVIMLKTVGVVLRGSGAA